jgi:hypothetical protein
MKRAEIKRNGVITNICEAEEAELNAWLQKHITMGTFGEPEREIEDIGAVIDQDGNVTALAVMKKVPGYVIEITDLTAQLEQEKRNNEAAKFLAETDWKVLRHKDQQDLGLATSLSAEEYQELLQQRQMARKAIIK